MSVNVRGGFVSVAAQRLTYRTTCKGCRRRRQVHRATGLCAECTKARGAAAASSSSSTSSSRDSPPDRNSISTSSGSSTSPPSSVCEMDGRASQQIQMLSNFLEVHFPLDTKLESDMHRKLSYLTVLPTVDISSPLLSSAINSLCLAHLGAKVRDDRLLHASQDEYGQVLGSLVQALRHAKNAPSRSHREVLASIMLISLYEENASVDQARSKSNFGTHFMGALKYLENIGPSCLDLSTLFDARLLQNLRMPALVFSLARRKALVFGRPEWKSPESQHIGKQGQGPNSWFPLMSGLPELLERADHFMNGWIPEDEQRLIDVCQDIHGYRAALSAWLEREFQGQVAPSYKAITTVGINDATAFDDEIEEHCFIVASGKIKSFHKFLGGAGQIIRCSMSWVACLILDTTLLRFFTRYPAAEWLVTQRSQDEVRMNAFNSAVDLCRCVYHYSALESIAYVDFLAIFIKMCQNFFGDYGAISEMGWCQACLIATDMREKRMRGTHRQTLCRVRDVSDELAAAGWFKPRNSGVYET